MRVLFAFLHAQILTTTGMLALQRPPQGAPHAVSVILLHLPHAPSGIPFPFSRKLGVLHRVLIPWALPGLTTLSQGQSPGDGGAAGVNTMSTCPLGSRKLRSASDPAGPTCFPIILAGGENHPVNDKGDPQGQKDLHSPPDQAQHSPPLSPPFLPQGFKMLFELNCDALSRFKLLGHSIHKYIRCTLCTRALYGYPEGD